MEGTFSELQTANGSSRIQSLPLNAEAVLVKQQNADRALQDHKAFESLAGALTAVAMGPDVGPGLHDVQETLHQVTLLMQVEIHPLSFTLASPTRHLIEQVLINQLQHRSSHRQERDISNGW